ncbi:MAG: DUF1796 family putative cysteine peptidase [Synechococcales bacterium]|nr:DUF1796 family putative cysteine peptidase [Synechococcales bacterium]
MSQPIAQSTQSVKYRFQLQAQTKVGESIGIVGSAPELGGWDITRYIPLRTSGDRYPLWWTDREITLPTHAIDGQVQQIEYKYVYIDAKGIASWEAWGWNRWLPVESAGQLVGQAGTHGSPTIVVDDGAFGYLQPYPFGYLETAEAETTQSDNPDGLKVVVIGSSVALGHRAWLLEGWAARLGKTLQQKYGHQLVNVSEVGANVGQTIARFPTVVVPEKPDIVIIALSLGNEGLAHCRPQDRRVVQRRFESGLQQLIKMTRQLGALPMLGAVYPHGDYQSEHHALLQDTHRRMMSWDVPVLNWLEALNDGKGAWKPSSSFDPAHPNHLGHQLMYEAIDLSLFNLTQEDIQRSLQQSQLRDEVPVYVDPSGFHISANLEDKQLRIINGSPYPYQIAAYWQELQTALQSNAKLIPGIYIARNAKPGILPYFTVSEEGAIETLVEIPAGTNLQYSSVFDLFSPGNSQLLFYDGHLGILKADEQHVWIINEAYQAYNVHPMWREVRNVLKAMPAGVYEDPLFPEEPFRTMMIGPDGLESRVKVPARSAVMLQYCCALNDISRVAILPLGDRCAARMMLYKMEYDGPAFPFDLTRTTQISDIADIIDTGFDEMWQPELLHYDSYIRRIYHLKWSGLSFAHEVEDSDDPVRDMRPVFARMKQRYSARANRFWYTIQQADELLFVRTGICDRAGVVDLLEKLTKHSQGKPFHLLLLSPQDSAEFDNLPQVLHHNVEFNPDLMYDNLEHWMYCTNIMKEILESIGISSKNLFWCPPNPPQVLL